MNIRKLMAIMFERKFFYFSGGLTNKGDLHLSFTTLSNGKGEEVDITIKETVCEIVFYTTPTAKSFFNLEEEDVYALINKYCIV